MMESLLRDSVRSELRRTAEATEHGKGLILSGRFVTSGVEADLSLVAGEDLLPTAGGPLSWAFFGPARA